MSKQIYLFAAPWLSNLPIPISNSKSHPQRQAAMIRTSNACFEKRALLGWFDRGSRPD